MARSRTGSGTLGTDFPFGDIQVHFRALGRVAEGNRQVVAQIGSGPGPAPAAGRAAKPEKIAENIPKRAEHILGRMEMIAKALAIDSGMAEAVILGALVRVTQDLVGLGRFLELCPRPPGIVRIAVRMKLKGELAVGAFDLVGQRSDSPPTPS